MVRSYHVSPKALFSDEESALLFKALIIPLWMIPGSL